MIPEAHGVARAHQCSRNSSDRWIEAVDGVHDAAETHAVAETVGEVTGSPEHMGSPHPMGSPDPKRPPRSMGSSMVSLL